ncbi:hypothetical protein [Nostoc commune]|nr:hypothetical protein [Nostoc commune]
MNESPTLAMFRVMLKPEITSGVLIACRDYIPPCAAVTEEEVTAKL